MLQRSEELVNKEKKRICKGTSAYFIGYEAVGQLVGNENGNQFRPPEDRFHYLLFRTICQAMITLEHICYSTFTVLHYSWWIIHVLLWYVFDVLSDQLWINLLSSKSAIPRQLENLAKFLYSRSNTWFPNFPQFPFCSTAVHPLFIWSTIDHMNSYFNDIICRPTKLWYQKLSQ